MIQTKIAKILSPSKVVLAAGAQEGVLEGMQFAIYELGDVILDPETQQPLGQLELHKARVKVSQVQEHLSVATTLSRQVERSALDMIAPSIIGRYTETVYPKLPLDESVSSTLSELPKLTVRVGDLVRSIE
jgi:Flagellar assembly protein T, C-terminal domain